MGFRRELYSKVRVLSGRTDGFTPEMAENLPSRSTPSTISLELVLPGFIHGPYYGPNGSGKSEAVDALQFGLTGQISQLIGRGTSQSTLKE